MTLGGYDIAPFTNREARKELNINVRALKRVRLALSNKHKIPKLSRKQIKGSFRICNESQILDFGVIGRRPYFQIRVKLIISIQMGNHGIRLEMV